MRSLRFSTLTVVLVWMLGVPRVAGAGTITVQYQVNSGSLVSGSLNFPVTSGFFTVTTQGTGPTTKASGAATLNTASAMGPNLSGNLIAAVAGTANLASTFVNQVMATLTGTVTGITGTGIAPVGQLTIMNAAAATATFRATGFAFGGIGVAVTGTLTLTGQEVSRSFIPEPGTFSLLGLGLVGLAAAGTGARRRRADTLCESADIPVS